LQFFSINDDHINGNRSDNSIWNIKYATSKIQASNRVITGRTRRIGRKVEQYDNEGNLIKVLDKIRDASNELGITEFNINAVYNENQNQQEVIF